jgi:hypothetical protein
MLQGILQAAGPVAYYSKVLKGVLFLDHRLWMLCLFLAKRFVHGSSFLSDLFLVSYRSSDSNQGGVI